MIRASILLLLTGFALAASARTSDRQENLEASANQLTDRAAEGVQLWRGDVIVTQGTLEILADTATVYRDPESDDITKIVFSGNPVHWREEMDDGERLHARAREMAYDLITAIVDLEGDVVVDKARDTLRGETLRYDLNTQQLDATPATGGRVRMIMRPADEPE